MIDIFIKAVHNFNDHQLGATSTHDTSFETTLLHYSTIELDFQGSKQTMQLWYSDDYVLRISNAMLFEPDPDEATIIDLVKETTNQIVGSAKIIASEEDVDFNIELPEYHGITLAHPSGTLCAFYIDNERILQIAL